MLKGILWDNDGVLVNTEHLFYEANCRLLGEYGVGLSLREYFDWFLQDDKGPWHTLAGFGVGEAQIPALRARRNRLYAQLLDEQADSLAIPGMQDLLARLQGRVSMGVVTSAYRSHFDQVHARLDYSGRLDFVFSAEDCQRSKPDPELYLKGLARLGLSADECVAVEDSPRGLAAARAAGLRCILVRHPLTAGGDFRHAYAVVDSVAELEALLDTLIGDQP